MTGHDPHASIRRPGPRSFCRPLWLSGWSERSIWGYDAPTGSYFAQLWPDGNDDDAPTVWFGASGELGSPSRLVAEVAFATRHPLAVVENALQSRQRLGITG